jgi:hypothetical protein
MLLPGPNPEQYLVESDLDWGQDLKRLSEWTRAHGLQQLSIGYFGSTDLDMFQLPRLTRLQALHWPEYSEYDFRMRSAMAAIPRLHEGRSLLFVASGSIIHST